MRVCMTKTAHIMRMLLAACLVYLRLNDNLRDQQGVICPCDVQLEENNSIVQPTAVRQHGFHDEQGFSCLGFRGFRTVATGRWVRARASLWGRKGSRLRVCRVCQSFVYAYAHGSGFRTLRVHA